VECSFDAPIELVSAQSPKILHSISKIVKSYKIFQNSLLSSKCFCGNIEWNFDFPEKNFEKWLKFFQSMSENGERVFGFSKTLGSLKMFLRTRRMQFWQHRRKVSIKGQQLYNYCPESSNIQNLSKRILLKMFAWTNKKEFWRHCHLFFISRNTFSPSMSEIDKKRQVHQKKVSLAKCPYEDVECRFNSPIELVSA